MTMPFFFSSRRRHTRLQGDWSSDVCSSDLEPVAVYAADDPRPITARIVAVDARVDPATRNALARARIQSQAPAPGASVRVEVPTGPSTTVLASPVSARRKGPAGDHVFRIAADSAGHTRAHVQPVQSGPVLDDDGVILR